MYHAGQEIWVSGSIWDDHPYSFNTSLRIVLRVTAYSTWACLQDVRDTNSARKALTCLKCKSWVAICGDSVRVKRCKEKKGNLKVMLHCGRSQGKLHKKRKHNAANAAIFGASFAIDPLRVLYSGMLVYSSRGYGFNAWKHSYKLESCRFGSTFWKTMQSYAENWLDFPRGWNSHGRIWEADPDLWDDLGRGWILSRGLCARQGDISTAYGMPSSSTMASVLGRISARRGTKI